MTDLTREQLDEWSERIDAHYRDNPDRNDLSTVIPTHQLSRILAMAKRTEAAESAMEMYACEMSQFADEVKGLERERDAVRNDRAEAHKEEA